MGISEISHDTPPRSPLDKPFFNKERLVNFLHRTLVLPHRSRDRTDAYRTALELRNDAVKNLVVDLIQTPLVNIKSIERITLYPQCLSLYLALILPDAAIINLCLNGRSEL